MSDRRAFINAILDAPDDDAHRLVYADWLQEVAGEYDRAEFIDVQIKLARMPEPDPCETEPGESQCADPDCAYRRIAGLRAREQELFNPDWFDPEGKTFNQVALEVDDYVPHRAYGKPVRGFVEYVRCEAAFWLAAADAITAEHPVREVRLTTWPDGALWQDHKNRGCHFRLAGRNHERFYGESILRHATPESLGTTPDGRPANIIRQLLADEWEGITFHLPATAFIAVGRINSGQMVYHVGDGMRVTAIPNGRPAGLAGDPDSWPRPPGAYGDAFASGDTVPVVPPA